MPKRERYLFVCVNERGADNPKGSCAHSGSLALKDQLKAGVVKRGLRKKVRVMEASCLDLCWVGCSMAIMPDDVFYGRVKMSDVEEILDSLEQGTVVERLVIADELFDDPASKQE